MKKLIICISALIIAFNTNAYAYELSDWAKEEYSEASAAGLLGFDNIKSNMRDKITREEICSLAVNMYKRLTGEVPIAPEVCPFEDCGAENVAIAYELGLVSGVTDTEFMPDDEVSRQQTAKILVSTLLKSGTDITIDKSDTALIDAFSDSDSVEDWAVKPMTVFLKENIMSAAEDSTLSPTAAVTREQAFAYANRLYSRFAETDNTALPNGVKNINNGDTINGDLVCEWDAVADAQQYKLILKNSEGDTKIVYTTQNLTAVIPEAKLTKGQQYSVILQTQLSNGCDVFSLPTEFTVAAAENYIPPQSTAKAATTDKEKRVFESGYYFSTSHEASQYMTDITVDVWKIASNGEKYASTLSLTVNRALAEDIKAIFSEIFNDSEQFPIKSAGCFQWRNSASGRLSQHSYGTCIDINPNENYYVSKSGAALSGSYWKPNTDPYSVTEDGIVVRTFAKYGFLWGGNAWGENSSKDYMHFTYLGN